MKIKDLEILKQKPENEPLFEWNLKYWNIIKLSFYPYFDCTVSDINSITFELKIKGLVKKIYFLIEKDLKILDLEKKDFIENNKNFSTESFNFSQPIDNPLEKLTTPINSQNATNSFKEMSNFELINSKSFDNIHNTIEKILIPFIEQNIQYSNIQKIYLPYFNNKEINVWIKDDLFLSDKYAIIDFKGYANVDPLSVNDPYIILLDPLSTNELPSSFMQTDQINKLHLINKGFTISNNFF